MLAFIVGSILFGIYIIAYVVPTEKKKLFVLSADENNFWSKEEENNYNDNNDGNYNTGVESNPDNELIYYPEVYKFKETKPTEGDWAKIWRHVVHNICQLENFNYNKSSVVNWFAIKAPGHGNTIYYGERTVNVIINGLYVNCYDQTLSSAREIYPNMSIKTFHESFQRLNGLWKLGYSLDHGVELAASQIILEDCAPKFILRKVTGDPIYPRFQTIKTEGIPIMGNPNPIPALVQVRSDIEDPLEWWEKATIKFLDEDTIELNYFDWQWNNYEWDEKPVQCWQQCTIKRYKPEEVLEDVHALLSYLNSADL